MMLDKLHVLVVDDDEDDLLLTCDCLLGTSAFKISIDRELNYKEALRKIKEDQHDLYLVDYLLGPHTGIDLMLESSKAGINKPFILLTGKGDHKVDIEASRAGAYDYLTKSELNPELLERSLRYSMQRYSAFRAVTESEKRYREIFVKSNDIIFVLDNQFRMVNFNPMMSMLLEYTPEELHNQPITELFDNSIEANRFINHIQSDSSGKSIEIVLLGKPGFRKVFLASCSNIISPEGEEHYQSILYDYTNIKKSYAEKLLKEKIETTERLVRSMAHEIRNPLTAINLSLYQLEKEVSEDGKNLTEIIKRNSDRINDLIVELMSLSNPVNKIEERIELGYLMNSVLAAAMDRIKLKGVQLFESYVPKQVHFIGDLRKLQIALVNIIINAVEAMEEGKGRLWLETLISDETVLIKISDNGIGIPAENLDHLFQPYYTNKRNGIGIGLSVTHSFVQAHGGSIEVDSTPGIGTSFIVKLKAATFQDLEAAKMNHMPYPSTA